MINFRTIPCLLLEDDSLVKTKNFSNPIYIGDAINTVRIFNELEVDEIILLDIKASKSQLNPRMDLLEEIANECFMPLAYGGGISNLQQAKDIISLGFEKIIINSSLFDKPDLVNRITSELGSQAVIGSIDVKKNIFGRYSCYSHSSSLNRKVSPIKWAKKLVASGVGELMITSIDNEGTWNGFDLQILEKIKNEVNVPIIAHGGAGKMDDIFKVYKLNINAAALGNLVVFQKKGMGILVNYQYSINENSHTR